MLTNVKQQEIGYAGLALLRNRLVGDSHTTTQIVDDINNLRKDLESENVSGCKIKEYETKSGYKHWSKTYDLLPNILIDVEEPITRSIVDAFPVGNSLDVACGTGRYCDYLSSLGHKVTGIDITPEMIEVAKKKIPSASFVEGSMEDLPFEQNSFDLIICSLALTHVSSINKSIEQMARVIKPGGHIILSDIHPWFVMIGGQAEFLSSEGKAGYVRNYVHFHSDYLQQFSNYGLSPLDCKEPALELCHLDPQKIGLSLSKTTMQAALLKLPIVLIWTLTKNY